MGFKTEQFLEEVDENLICGICLDVLEDPWQCRHGHVFCKDCITRCLQTNQTCPECKNVLQIESLARCLRMNNFIENLKVYCHTPESDGQAADKMDVAEESELKCDWTGKLQSLDKHRETCPFQQVQCPNVDCNTNMQRRVLEDHDKICYYKRVECKKCRKVLVRLELPAHKRFICPEELVPCPNMCKSQETRQINKIRRIDVKDHLRNECAKTILNCPFKDQGCSVQVQRQHIDKHVRDNMAAHMMLLAKQCSSLAEQNKTLNEQCSELTKKCASLTEECSTLKQNFVSLTEENRLLKKNDELSRTYTWKIRNYLDYYHEKPNRRYYGDDADDAINKLRSPVFWLCGYSWFLVLYPNGKSKENREFVSVGLHMGNNSYDPRKSPVAPYKFPFREIRTETADISVTCRLSVISHIPGIPDVTSQKTNEVSSRSYEYCVTQWPRFMKSDDAFSEAYCVQFKQEAGISTYDYYRLSNNGSLTIQCTIQLDKPQ